MSRIIAKALAGLANKLRVMESAVSLGKDLSAPVDILWVPDFQMVAHYHELFEPTRLFRVINSNKYSYSRSSFSLHGIKKPVAGLINTFYGIDLSFNDIDIANKVRPGHWDILELAKNKTVYIDSCHDFYPYRYNFSWAQPLPAIAEAIASFSEKMQHHYCVGMHIRRTDNAASIAQSPDILFEQAIRREIAGNENVVFFLATDNPDTEKHFINLFGADRILVYPKRFGRDNVAAIQDAVVDWTLLGKCAKLYISYFSSFSETAASVAGIDAIVCKTQPHQTIAG